MAHADNADFYRCGRSRSDMDTGGSSSYLDQTIPEAGDNDAYNAWCLLFIVRGNIKKYHLPSAAVLRAAGAGHYNTAAGREIFVSLGAYIIIVCRGIVVVVCRQTV